MQQNDRRAFGDAMAATFAVYGQSLTKDVIELWWRVLDGYRIDAVLTALSHHVGDFEGHGHRVPTPADIRRHLEKTLPALARAEARPFVDQHERRIAGSTEEMRRIDADVLLGLMDRDDAILRFRALKAQHRELCADPAYRLALDGPKIRETASIEPDRTWLPPVIRKGIALLTGKRDG